MLNYSIFLKCDSLNLFCKDNVNEATKVAYYNKLQLDSLNASQTNRKSDSFNSNNKLILRIYYSIEQVTTTG